MYLPDGDRLRKLGYFIEPNERRKGLFNLPILSQEVCGELLESHEADLAGMKVSEEAKSKWISEDQLKRMPDEYKDELSVVELLRLGQENSTFAPLCYSICVETLMNQSDKPFLFVLDEFNCYYDSGHYFHAEYDSEVENAIPYNKITLFKPFLDAMGLSLGEEESDEASIKRGGVVIGVTESRAVGRNVTDPLLGVAIVESEKQSEECPLTVVTVPRYSNVEVEHILSNLESIGIGRLRFDRGSTVMDDQEVAYLRMISGAVGQNLLDACIL